MEPQPIPAPVGLLDTFAELFSSSVIIRGLVAIIAIGTTMALELQGRPMPNELWIIDGIVLTSLYGAAGNLQLSRAVTAMTKTVTTMAKPGEKNGPS